MQIRLFIKITLLYYFSSMLFRLNIQVSLYPSPQLLHLNYLLILHQPTSYHCPMHPHSFNISIYFYFYFTM